jgi:hypothetical protein
MTGSSVKLSKADIRAIVNQMPEVKHVGAAVHERGSIPIVYTDLPLHRNVGRPKVDLGPPSVEMNLEMGGSRRKVLETKLELHEEPQLDPRV